MRTSITKAEAKLMADVCAYFLTPPSQHDCNRRVRVHFGGKWLTSIDLSKDEADRYAAQHRGLGYKVEVVPPGIDCETCASDIKDAKADVEEAARRLDDARDRLARAGRP